MYINYKKIFFLIIIYLIFKYIIFYNIDVLKCEKNNLISKCWINNNIYPEAQIIFNNRNIIQKELYNVLNNNWSIWSNDYKETPIFTNMSDNDIINRLEKNNSKIGSSNDPSWRLYSLILNKKILKNSKNCPNTIKLLLESSDRILNAGFSLLEPNCYIGLHKDFNDKFYRLHIPLLIPKNNDLYNKSIISKDEINNLTVLQVENDYRIWKSDEYFIFDDTCYHNAWNYTNENRIILIVDLLKE